MGKYGSAIWNPSLAVTLSLVTDVATNLLGKYLKKNGFSSVYGIWLHYTVLVWV